MMKVSVLASGSKGNSFLIKTNKTKILLDAGLSGKKIIELLQMIDLDFDKIQAVIVSHEHSDHIKGAGIVCRKLKIPLYITKHTHFAGKKAIGEVKNVIYFDSGDSFQIGDIVVETIPSFHDAVDGNNFIFSQIENSVQKLAIFTDLGYPSNLHLQKLRDVTTIVLESNHDLKMLLNGPYPWPLKQRVKSKHGHLSNEQAVGVIQQVITNANLQNLILAHLSETNNTPEKARETMLNFLEMINSNVKLFVSNQYKPTELIDC